jgi:hypothetical protein
MSTKLPATKKSENKLPDYEALFRRISKRYSNVDTDALAAVLTPILIPIKSLDKEVKKIPGQTHWRASFALELKPEWASLMHRGATGKFVPASFQVDGLWREICKGRIVNVDFQNNLVEGEIYLGKSSKTELTAAVNELTGKDFLEIDQFGASAKILSSLSEYYLAKQATDLGYIVRRMPEDTARHLGAYYNYDFEFEKNGVTKKIEVKSLWGTNTAYARLIHSKTSKPKGDPSTWSIAEQKSYYPTSSCKFATQDIFAVSLFLKTGNIKQFAFARSVSIANQPHGLAFAPKHPDHVHQNPICEIGNGSWFATIDEVWNLP